MIDNHNSRKRLRSHLKMSFNSSSVCDHQTQQQTSATKDDDAKPRDIISIILMHCFVFD